LTVLKKLIGDSTNNLDSTRNTLQNVETRVFDLENRNRTEETKVGQLDRTAKENQEKEKTKASLEVQLRELEAQAKANKDKSANNDTNMRTLNKNLDDAKANLVTLEGQLQNKSDTLATLRSEYSDLQDISESDRKRISELENSSSVSSSSGSSDLSEYTRQIKALEAELVRIKSSPPSMSGGGVPPPPSGGAPPPPPPSGGPPPPPPGGAPNLPPVDPTRGALLSSIQGFTKNKLKKAPKVEEKPLAERLNTSGGTSGGSTGGGPDSIAQMAVAQLGKLKKTERKN